MKRRWRAVQVPNGEIRSCVVDRDVTSRERNMQEVAVVGLHLAKTVFQVLGIDAAGVVVRRKPLRRNQAVAFFGALSPCLVGMTTWPSRRSSTCRRR